MSLTNLRPRVAVVGSGIATLGGGRSYDRLRGSAHARGYDRAWESVRSVHLQGEPLCRFCSEQGIVAAATVVDHIETIVDRPDLRLVDSNLRSLCEPCHNAHTARQVAAGHRSAAARGDAS